jgi:hypothetical protein
MKELSPTETVSVYRKQAKPKADLPKLFADYEKSKAHAIECLTGLEERTGLSFRLPDLKSVDPLKRMRIRFIRDMIDSEYRANPSSKYIELLVGAWNALYHLSNTHSAYYAAYQAEHKDNE